MNHFPSPLKTRGVQFSKLFLGLTTCLAFLLCFAEPIAAQTKTFEVKNFGAKGDGKILDTAAIQKALDACGDAGGGTVRFSQGTYLSKPLFLRSKTTLQLDKGAILIATDDPQDFLPSGVLWKDAQGSNFIAFINAKNLTNISITGEGTIDGSGARWWIPAEEARRKTPGYTLPRPRLILFSGCKNVNVSGVTLQNAPAFHLVPFDCEDVVIEGVKITAPPHSANTDAIDPSVSRRVLITKCVIDVGDDNIAIKSGRRMPGRNFACEDITITDCIFRHGHGMSIGSETSGGVRNVTVKNCTFDGTENGIRIKSPRGKGGVVENLLCENIHMTNVDRALTITCYYPKIPKADSAQAVTKGTPAFRNLHFKNLTATCPNDAGLIIGLPESQIDNVVLENVKISAQTGFKIRNAKGVELKNVEVTVKKGAPFIIENAAVRGLTAADTKLK